MAFTDIPGAECPLRASGASFFYLLNDSLNPVRDVKRMYTYPEIKALVDEIRLVNRAKLILIKIYGMTEPEAQRAITKSAMDRCVRKRAVALEIITLHELGDHQNAK